MTPTPEELAALVQVAQATAVVLARYRSSLADPLFRVLLPFTPPPKTDGERLWEALCLYMLDSTASWADQAPFRQAKYESAARAFLASREEPHE